MEAGLAADILLVFSGDFFERSDLTTLRDLAQRLPADIIEARPGLCFVYGWSLLATGRWADVEGLLSAIERAIGFTSDGSADSRDAPPRIRCALAEVAVMRSSLAFARFDTDEIKRQGLLALEYLPERADDQIFNAPPVRTASNPRNAKAPAVRNSSSAFLCPSVDRRI